MSAFADLCRFVPTAGGTTDWVYSSAVGGCQSPTAANVQNGVSYKVYAVSADLTQWETSQGVYNSSTGTFPRSTVLANSSGTGTSAGQTGAGSKISFSAVPQVAVVALAEDLISVETANGFTATQQAQARANIGVANRTNLLRNGTFDIWQRGTSIALAASTYTYTADGWMAYTTSGTGSVAQASNSRTGANTVWGLQITGATGVTDAGCKQRIESYLAARANGKNVTFQAWIYNNTGATITPSLSVNHATAVDNFASTASELGATSLQACSNAAWTQVSYTLAVSSNAANGLEFLIDCGNNFSSNAKTVIIAEADIQVTPSLATGLQSAPPLPEFREITDELLLNQRYYATSYGNNVAPGTATTAGMVFVDYDSGSTITGYATTDFPAQLRAVPTMAYYDGAGNASKLSYLGNGGSTSFTNNGTPNAGTQFFCVGKSSFSFVGFVSSTVGNYFIHYTASAEL